MKDYKTELLLGKDLKFNDIGKLYSLTIDEILEIGFDEYNQAIGMLCMDKNDIDDLLEGKVEEEIEPFIFILHNCMHGNELMREKIIDAFSMIFKESVGASDQGYFFLGELTEERFITGKNFNYMVDLIKQQNCIKTSTIEKKKRPKPKNEAQRAYYEKAREVEEKLKSQQGDSDISHIISAVSAKHNSMNLLNIGKLTMYQLIDQYKRLCSVEEYSLSINGMMHGASSDAKVKHWSEPID